LERIVSLEKKFHAAINKIIRREGIMALLKDEIKMKLSLLNNLV
jgi:hypothetical protein